MFIFVFALSKYLRYKHKYRPGEKTKEEYTTPDIDPNYGHHVLPKALEKYKKY